MATPTQLACENAKHILEPREALQRSGPAHRAERGGPREAAAGEGGAQAPAARAAAPRLVRRARPPPGLPAASSGSSERARRWRTGWSAAPWHGPGGLCPWSPSRAPTLCVPASWHRWRFADPAFPSLCIQLCHRQQHPSDNTVHTTTTINTANQRCPPALHPVLPLPVPLTAGNAGGAPHVHASPPASLFVITEHTSTANTVNAMGTRNPADQRGPTSTVGEPACGVLGGLDLFRSSPVGRGVGWAQPVPRSTAQEPARGRQRGAKRSPPHCSVACVVQMGTRGGVCGGRGLKLEGRHLSHGSTRARGQSVASSLECCLPWVCGVLTGA